MPQPFTAMIFTQSAAREKISSLEARITALESDLVSKDEAIAAMESEITAKDQTIAEHVASLQTRDEKITELESKVTETAEQLEAKEIEAKEAKESAGKEATEILAAIGQDEPLALTESAPPVDHLEAMKNMEPGQKRAYWKANKEAIHAQLNQR